MGSELPLAYRGHFLTIVLDQSYPGCRRSLGRDGWSNFALQQLSVNSSAGPFPPNLLYYPWEFSYTTRDMDTVQCGIHESCSWKDRNCGRIKTKCLVQYSLQIWQLVACLSLGLEHICSNECSMTYHRIWSFITSRESRL